MPTKKKPVELTPEEKEVKYLKSRYHELVMDKNSYLHDLHSPVAQCSEEIAAVYHRKIAEIDGYIEKVKDQLIAKGFRLHRGQWLVGENQN
ncbi:hypothetical protein [Cysteiniphilum marinum]|uniref:hypothetical protein n=1 Tax=Cysteiniphilum marinum TaxID=2774191 RepID=UPI00193AC480|nr:hypothetical protein [Cysteiniphilum marinum]